MPSRTAKYGSAKEGSARNDRVAKTKMKDDTRIGFCPSSTGAVFAQTGLLVNRTFDLYAVFARMRRNCRSTVSTSIAAMHLRPIGQVLR